MVINTVVYAINKDDVDILAVLSDFGAASETYDGAPLIGDLGIDTGHDGPLDDGLELVAGRRGHAR